METPSLPPSICPVCKTALQSYDMGEKNGFGLIACRACGSVMTDQIPIPEEIEQFYADVDPEITHVPNPVGAIDHFKGILKKTKRVRSGATFLDLQARQGYAVAAAQEMGMQAHGIDRHDFFIRFAAAQYGRSHFTLARPEEYLQTHPPADLVFAIDLFSEAYDLDAAAQSLRHAIAPNGIAYVQDADGNSFNLPRTFADWNYAFPPLNHFYLSKQGMTAVLRRNGLKIVKTFFTWAPLQRHLVTRDT
jgi:hypothetical protein